MQEKTDKELYKEFLLGNNESFEEIVKRHKKFNYIFYTKIYQKHRYSRRFSTRCIFICINS